MKFTLKYLKKVNAEADRILDLFERHHRPVGNGVAEKLQNAIDTFKRDVNPRSLRGNLDYPHVGELAYSRYLLNRAKHQALA
jgi:hypothetical protein